MRERKNIAAPKETPIRTAPHAPRPATRRATEPRAPRATPPHPSAIAPFTITPKPDPRGGTPIDDSLRRGEEARTGADLRPVRLHQDAQSARAGEAHSARALTVGEHVYAGRRTPDLQSTREGRSILRHELQHVLETRRDPSLRETPLRLPEDQVILQMEQRIAANDVPGALQILRSEAGLHAGSAAVRGAISNFLTRAQFTQGQAWRAVALQIHGTEVTWPRVLRNFVDGVETSVFTPPAGMPPSIGPELVQVAVHTATLATASTTDFERYQAEFDSLWRLPRFQAFSAEFNPVLDSRGPRNSRAREIFRDIYGRRAAVQSAYDIGGIVRRLIDAYIGPEGMNPDASPRLELLRRTISGVPLAAATVADPAYVALKTSVTSAAQNLDSNDRQVFESAHEWRLHIERIVTPSALRNDLRTTIRTAWASAPPVPSPSPSPSPTVSPTVVPPLTLTADQQTFVNNLTLAVPATPISSAAETHMLTFNPSSTRDPAGLTVRSRVETAPAGQVRSDGVSEQPWPPTALAGAAHRPLIETGGTAGFTDFTGSLTVVPASGSIRQMPRTATVRVNDTRRTFFTTNIRHGLRFSDQNRRFLWDPSSVVRYYGGFNSIRVQPVMASGVNPGLTVFAAATLSRNAALLHTFPREQFGLQDATISLGGVLVLETVPTPATDDAMELVVTFSPSADPAIAAFHTITQPFTIRRGSTYTHATVLARLRDDYTLLNATGSGSYLARMRNASLMGARAAQAARVADAVQHRNIEVEPFLIRPDSAAYIRSTAPARVSEFVAYAIGHTAIDPANTKIDRPNADAWRWPSHPRGIYINLTPSLDAPGTKRDADFVINFIIHEAVHALDLPRAASTPLERYKTEFRAYWMGGDHDINPATHAAFSTAYNPSMDSRGPKTEKSRAIFRHLYRNPLYSYVQPNYDDNTAHFRERVNEFLYPEGVNIIVSRHLDNLRTEIENFGGVDFPAHRIRVINLWALVPVAERQEIVNNAAWRDLLRSKYNPAQYIDIRTFLGVPA